MEFSGNLLFCKQLTFHQPFVPEEHIRKIGDFVNAINEDNILPGTVSRKPPGGNDLTSFLLQFSVVIKVNNMEYEGQRNNSIPTAEEVMDYIDAWGALPNINGTRRSKYIRREQNTTLWVIDPGTSKYIKVNYRKFLIPFKPAGYGSYQVYQNKCNKVYRIGYLEMTRSRRNPSFELRCSYGCGALDVALGYTSRRHLIKEHRKLTEKREGDRLVNWLSCFESEFEIESAYDSESTCVPKPLGNSAKRFLL